MAGQVAGAVKGQVMTAAQQNAMQRIQSNNEKLMRMTRIASPTSRAAPRFTPQHPAAIPDSSDLTQLLHGKQLRDGEMEEYLQVCSVMLSATRVRVSLWQRVLFAQRVSWCRSCFGSQMPISMAL